MRGRAAIDTVRSTLRDRRCSIGAEGGTSEMSEATPDGSAPPLPGDVWTALRRHRGWFLALGIVWIVCGTAAIVLPLAAAVALELVIGVLLAVGGLVQIVQSLRCAEWKGKLLQAVIGLIALVAGVILLANPLQGVPTLTLVLSAFFIAAGVVRVMLALQHREAAGWGWLLFSGALGIVVGVLIWSGWPGTAAWALGLLVGIELIFSGWSMVMLALGAGRAR
jgi:uncharacterized membrane protein HdeD (DUF308 family)